MLPGAFPCIHWLALPKIHFHQIRGGTSNLSTILRSCMTCLADWQRAGRLCPPCTKTSVLPIASTNMSGFYPIALRDRPLAKKEHALRVPVNTVLEIQSKEPRPTLSRKLSQDASWMAFDGTYGRKHGCLFHNLGPHLRFLSRGAEEHIEGVLLTCGMLCPVNPYNSVKTAGRMSPLGLANPFTNIKGIVPSMFTVDHSAPPQLSLGEGAGMYNVAAFRAGI